MTIAKVTAALLLTAVLAGCVSRAQMNKMPGADADVPTEKSTAADALSASGESLAAAVRESLQAAGLLGREGRYRLDIKLREVDKPLMGLSMTVTTLAHYRLTDTQTRTVMLDETIRAPFTAKMFEALDASHRVRLATEGSIRANAAALMNRIAPLELGNGTLYLGSH